MIHTVEAREKHDFGNIRVSCAVIVHNGKVLAAQRAGTGEFSGKWEFPGGKIKLPETPEETLVRELQEELEVSVVVDRPLTVVVHRYPDREVTLYPFLARIRQGTPTLRVHSRILWIDPARFSDLDWLEGDFPILEEVTRVLVR
ncbi:MAG: (deoxy)nucleoside triphosphate pyrophosphohydrolase [Leptospirales bacterium]